MRAFLSAAMVAVVGLSVLGYGQASEAADPQQQEQQKQEVVLYTSVDEPYARPIAEDFEKRTGIRVLFQTDVEATKTTGLVERLRAERGNVQADVWWNNEVFHTVNLAEEGVLAAYDSPVAADIPARYKDPQNRWATTALRVRVLCVTGHPEGQAAAAKVQRVQDLTDPALKGRIAMGRPALGTIGGQVAALYAIWGDEKAQQFFRDLKANDIKLVGGNSVVSQYTGNGRIWAGLTDNDDVWATQAEGGKIEMVLPNQGADDIGTLAVPTTVSLVAGGKNPEAAKKLIDYLLSKEVGQRLRDVKYAAYDVRSVPTDVKFMDVDYREVARIMPRAVQSATAIMEGRE